MDSFRKRFTRNKHTLQSDIQLRFLQLLNRLLINGYSILEALDSMKWNKGMDKPADTVISLLQNGLAIDEAFEKAGFHHAITSYLYFVRRNGDLQGSIEKCATMYEHRIKYMKKFQQVTRYPILLFFIFGILLYFIKQNVLPSFQNIFQANTESSSTVEISIHIIDLFTSILIVFIIFISIAVLVWSQIRKKLSIEKRIKVYEKVPIYRKYLKLQTSFHFAAHFSSLLKTGMSLKEILHHMSTQQKLPIVAYYTQLMTLELSKGMHISSLLSVFTFLEGPLTAIFQKNSDARSLEKDLSIYAELLMEEIQRKIIKSITFIQPVFFLILAGFIIFIYITLMWPMFQLIKTV